MRQAKTGYTIFEVMIVLAITGLIFASAATMLKGKSSQTGFTQAVQDLSSKIQTTASQVKSGSFSETGSYNCTIVGGYAKLTSGSGNDGCIVLGRAFQTTPNDGKIYIYTVLGSSTIWQFGVNTGQTASKLIDSNPEPAFPNGATTVDLTETYTLGSDTKVLSSKVSGTAYNMTGIYASLDTGQFTGYAYPLAATTKNSGSVKTCIEQSTCNPVSMIQWDLCLVSSSGGNKQQVSVSITPSGVTTKVVDVACT